MPSIPVYRQTTLPGGGAAASPADNSAPPVEGIARGMNDLGQGGQSLALGMVAQQRQDREDDAAVQATKQLAGGRAFWLEQVSARADKYNPGDAATPYGSFQTGVLQDFDKWQTEEVSKAATPRSGRFLQQRFAELRGTLQNETFAIERTKRLEHNIATMDASREVDQTTVYQYPSLRGTVLGERFAAIDALSGVSETNKVKMREAERDGINLASERGELDRNPRRWYEDRFGAPFQGKGGMAGGAGASGAVPPADFNFPMRLTDDTRKWIGPVNEAAERAGVDQNVLLALVEQESKGRPRAQSGKGARGLAQLMPDAAAEVGVKNVQDPVENINGGARYLAKQLAKNDGDYEMALAAYNAGPGALEKAKARALKSGGTYLDYLPSETRDYVKTIMGNVRAPAEPSSPGDGAGNPNAAARTAEPRDGPASWLGLSYEKREALRTHAEQLMGQQATAALGMLKDRVANAQAMAAKGLQDPDPIRPEVFEAAGPEGAKLGRSYAVAQATATKVGAFEQQPSPEIIAAVRSSIPRAGEMFRDEQAGHLAAVQAAQAVLKQREEDPAVAVLGYHKPAQTAWDAVVQATKPGVPVDQARAATAAYASTMLEEQKRLQLQPGTAKVVPQAYADSVVQLFDKAVPSGQAAEQVVQMQRLWGRYWPRVLAQVSKDLPSSAVVISDVESQAVREQIARVATVKMADLKAGLDPADVKATTEATAKDSVLGSWRLSLEPTPDGTGVFSKYQDVIDRVALSNVRAGMKPGDAARDAIDKVVGDKYAFQGDPARPYAVPRAEKPELVKAGTEAVLGRLAEQSIMLPADRLGAGSAGELPPAEIKRQYLEQVRQHAVWVRTPDDDGLRLYAVGFDGRMRTVASSSGAPVQFTWQQLRVAGMDTNPMNRAVVGRVGGMGYSRPPAADAGETFAPAP